MENIKNIKDYQDIDKFLLKIDSNKNVNLKFLSNNLKHYFFSRLQESNDIYNIINCNSGIERFYIDYQLEGIKIFDNLNLCKDFDILKIVKNTKGISIW